MKQLLNIWNSCGVLFGVSATLLNAYVGNYWFAAVALACGIYCYTQLEEVR